MKPGQDKPHKNSRLSAYARLCLPIILLAAGLACALPVNLMPEPTPTPTATATITPNPTPTPLPTLTPAPTLAPAVQIEGGDQALFYGDWETALAEYQLAFENATDPEIRAAARLGIGRAQHALGNLSFALNSLRALVEEYPDSPHQAAGYFFLARVFNDLQRYSEAAGAYDQYLARRPGIVDSYVQEWRGDTLQSAGLYAEAMNAYSAALQAPSIRDPQQTQIKVAQALTAQGEYETALAIYDDIYQTTGNDYVRAQVNLQRGGLHLLLGNPEQAYTHYQDSVENFPLAYDSYLALVELINAGVPVNEFDRGLINYYVGQNGLALGAFDRHLLGAAAEPGDGGAALTAAPGGAVYYYRGLALRNMQEYQSALNTWDEGIANYDAGDPYWDDIWDEKGYTQWAYMDQYTEAEETYLAFAATVPGHSRAGEFIFYAAQIAERAGRLGRAAELWGQLNIEYPTHHLAYRASFLTGITYYRQGNYPQALFAFQNALSQAINPYDQSAASFWIGKAQQIMNDANAARLTWEATASMDPTGYYSERARDMLLGREPFSPPAVYDLATDPATERSLAEGWLRATFGLPAEVDLSSPGPLLSDARFIRGTELWNLGEQDLARAEFEGLRLSVQHDPAANYRLANYLLELGVYRTAIFCARQVLNLAGLDDAGTLTAPAYFNHIRFGTYYGNLIIPAAQENGLHPLLVFSLTRQESLFEGFVRSSAGARGLMQIIPPTGQGIFNNLGWPPGYTADDLYRPVVNVTFGTDYLADQLAFLDGSIHAALAAYNGGPGNANVWKNLTGDDPDLFVEIIRFSETRNYVRGVYEIFSIYRRVYDRTP